MANVRQDNVQIKIEVDGSQSKTELDNLTRRAQVLTQDLKEMKRGTTEYIEANKELRQVNARMAELRQELGTAGLSMGQLGRLSNQLGRELRELVPGTEAFVNKSKELQEVDTRLGQLRREVRGVQDGLEEAGGGFGSFLKKSAAFAGVQLGVQAVVSSLVNFGKESLAEFAQAEGAAAQLQAALTSTGNAAGLTKKELLDLSASLEGKTILDGDSITQAQSVLLTFTKIKKGVYEEALPAIVDMATRLGGDGPADLQGATIQVGKALNDPIKGITALGKAGVSFSEDQKVMIKSLVETGDVAGAQAIILGELKTEFGGSAEAAAKAGTGPLKQFEVQIGNVKEGVGKLITDGLVAIQPVLRAALGLFAFFIEALKAAPAFLVENRGLLLALGVAILTLNAANIQAAASSLAAAAAERIRTAATIATKFATEGLGAAMKANPIGFFIAAVALLVGGLITLYERSEKVREVFAGLGAAANQVFQNIKNAVVLQLGGVADLLTGIFTLDLDKIKAGVSKLGEGLKQQYTGLGNGVAGAYGAAYADREKLEHAASLERDKKAAELKVQRAKEAAEKTATADREAALGSAKRQEADLKVRLSRAEEGSRDELNLKKRLVQVAADIEALGEKKSADDKRVIRAEAQANITKLDREYAKKQHDEAEKAGKEQLEVEQKLANLRAATAGDESARKIAQLTAAAAKEKAEAKGTAEQIAEQRLLIDARLARELAAEREKAGAAAAAIDADIEKRRTALIADEYQRRAAEVRAAAVAESAKLKGTDEQLAEARRLIAEKLANDLAANEAKRVQADQDAASRVLAIDQDLATRRTSKSVEETSFLSDARIQAEAAEHAARLAQLDTQLTTQLDNEKLSINERLALIRQFNADRDQLDEEYADRTKARNRDTATFGLQAITTGINAAADFQKISSDKEIAKVENDKKKRLASLDAEYKAGKLSKEGYEAQKSVIEANYDAKTKQLRRQQAERDKMYQIANSIIQGTVAVIAASANPLGILSPTAIATGIAAVLATAKIIATPVPEFAKGGVAGPRLPWRERVRQFAQGGINAVAGVASVGQHHSGGGIRMVDGATGEHLGEWERGEPYMILSRETYANNRHLVDDLLDTSLHRGGAPVRSRAGHYEDGGVAGDGTAAARPVAAGGDKSEQLLTRIAEGVERIPSRLAIAWDDDDTQNVEARLGERADVRERAQIR